MQLTQTISKWIDRCLSFLGRDRKVSQEPKDAPTIIFTLPDGRKLTMEDLQGLTGRVYVRDGKLLDVTGTVRYEIIGKGSIPRAAEALHQQAREAGGRGEYEKAIALLERASELAPEWPYPVYDRAFTHMLMNDFDGENVLSKDVRIVASRVFCRDYCPAHLSPGTERRPPRWNLPGIRILGVDERRSEKRACRARDG
jgi:hypothetical protein